MTRKKSLKTALLMSGISMLLCSAMLAGTTFAWFSDTATSGENTIVAGNLHVQLQYDSDSAAENEEDWKDASAQKLFKEDFTWEPGAMLISTPFRVKNTGDLALDYTISINAEDVVAEGTERKLSEVILMRVVTLSTLTESGYQLQEDPDANRPEVWEACATEATLTGKLEANEASDALVVVLYWLPHGEATDNLYNVADPEGNPLLSITYSVSVLAKQAVSESEKDSVGTDYDKDATYPEA